MQQQYYIADLHLGHGDTILRFRPQFSSWEEHDDYVVGMINETVNPTDSLYIAGDTLIKDIGIPYLKKIACRNIYLVPGNHCGERTMLSTLPYKRIQGAMTLKLGDRIGVVTHIPVHPTCLEERWGFNIHGHLHEQSLIDKRYLCISCEQTGYKPVTKKWMEQKLKGNEK